MLFLSDIHGSLAALEKALLWDVKLKTKHIVLLGDLLNHGPRNPIPPGYDPAAVATTLNGLAQRIIAIRGNCDSEVDQMLLDFPMLAAYGWLVVEGRRIYLTHGHLEGPASPPPLARGEGFIFGHTHLPVAKWQNEMMIFNPGSLTLPKKGYEASFGHFDGESFVVRSLVNGGEMMRVHWKRAF